MAGPILTGLLLPGSWRAAQAQLPTNLYGRHSKTTRRCANMAGKLQSLRLLSALLIAAVADPAPGRVPKVYNALITSNQNLEPSKAYPVYQPVLHDAVFSIQPSVLYGGHFPFGNGILPQPAQIPNDAHPPSQPPQSAVSTGENSATKAPSTEPSATSTTQTPENPQADNDSTTAPPPPPNTESPIPLNEFGLPQQVLPLGRIDPAYNGFTQLGPFTYSYPHYSPYPGVRLYDPFDPFSLGPYGFPLYRPLPNVLGPSAPFIPAGLPAPVPSATAAPAVSDQSVQTPPPEPSDLNVLNYSSKDPAIPNVPPPPLPQGGLKSDKSE